MNSLNNLEDPTLKNDETEYNSYFSFVSTSYPKSSWGQSKNERKIFKNISYSIETLDIYISISKKQKIKSELLLDLKVLLKHYLFLLPLKNPIAYPSTMRAIAETMMKIMYSSIHVNEDLDTIRSLSYKKLAEAVDSSMTLKSVLRNSTLETKQKYGNSSVSIHAKKGFSEYDEPYISNFFKDYIPDNILLKDSLSIHEFVTKSIFIINNYEDKDFGHNQKILFEQLSS